MPKLPQPEIEVVHEGADIVGESPMWHPLEGRLYWVDTRYPALQRLEADGTVRRWTMPSNIGSFVFRRGGGVVAGLKQGFVTVDLETGAVTPVLDPEPDQPENRLNDGRCDRRGRYWCGSRDPGDENPGGSLFRLSPDMACERMDTGFIVSNGMAFSPDDRTMIFGDSRGEVMWRYDLDIESGRIANRRVFLSTAGLPWRVDGATFDAEGYYWCALIGDGAIGRFDPEGRLDRIVRLPVSHPTMCNFGGPDLDVLYVTSGTVFLGEAERARQPLAGALLALHGLGVRGVPEPLFEG
ncbi:SMP-30/gluconolactonase/LRE family protein [Pararoseomonas indoligenes]|uniref:SMP-30/gluconolactonase/LRE family protein n=1 Tax=Roseomonas indoligenes TaxID=2820811 RepID=A0A940S9R0_9PROT|nr:SMP-30/gluconolactonase/LRE family protein [Pararoseomonas indoligenes]MBP0495417.1 SMP-30/gluconolactonase/LRE family protein [Pararoseomonas indoligenes]